MRNIWLEQCPARFKALYYRRYVDDGLAVFSDAFRSRSLFLDYLNTKHNNIKFTMKHQESSTFSFLETNICVIDNKIEISICQ